jgi:hypothetical protein
VVKIRLSVRVSITNHQQTSKEENLCSFRIHEQDISMRSRTTTSLGMEDMEDMEDMEGTDMDGMERSQTRKRNKLRTLKRSRLRRLHLRLRIWRRSNIHIPNRHNRPGRTTGINDMAGGGPGGEGRFGDAIGTTAVGRAAGLVVGRAPGLVVGRAPGLAVGRAPLFKHGAH